MRVYVLPALDGASHALGLDFDLCLPLLLWHVLLCCLGGDADGESAGLMQGLVAVGCRPAAACPPRALPRRSVLDRLGPLSGAHPCCRHLGRRDDVLEVQVRIPRGTWRLGTRVAGHHTQDNTLFHRHTELGLGGGAPAQGLVLERYACSTRGSR